MKELDLSVEILAEIIDNGVKFNDALKAKFQNDVSIRPFRKDVAGLVGCELRHDMLFAFLLKGFAWSEEEKRVASLLLANNFFYKHFPADMVKNAALEKLGEEKMAELADLLAKEGNPEAYVPENIKRGSLEYLSLRYNTPMWVLKIWEHFGYGIAYRVLRKNIRPKGVTLRVRNLPGLAESVASSAEYLPTTVEGIVSYQGKTPIRKVEFVKNGSLFEEKTAIKAILDQVKVSEPSEAFLFSDLKNDQAIKEFIESYGESIGLNVGVASLDNEHADAVRFIKEKKLRNVNLFASSADGFEASISRPQDLVAVFAESTDFDAIRETPDFFVHCKPEMLDALLERQKALLDGAAPFVALDGKLVYCVFTLSKKEGRNQVSEFIKTHGEFTLEKEEQIFPYDNLDVTCYYAILKKGAPVEKATPTIPEAALLAAAQPELRAEGE
ncbi:MAG: hypothetical protein J6328_00535 [Bacilli bacterium]|nr:hypothetical protein [Bacilli bacterium]